MRSLVVILLASEIFGAHFFRFRRTNTTTMSVTDRDGPLSSLLLGGEDDWFDIGFEGALTCYSAIADVTHGAEVLEEGSCKCFVTALRCPCCHGDSGHKICPVLFQSSFDF